MLSQQQIKQERNKIRIYALSLVVDQVSAWKIHLIQNLSKGILNQKLLDKVSSEDTSRPIILPNKMDGASIDNLNGQ